MSSSTGNSARHRMLASGSTSTRRTSSPRPGLGHHGALGVDHDGVPAELDARLGAHLVARDEPGLVLDRAGPREDVPVLDARRRPAGRQQERRGPALRERAEELGEAQVVAGRQPGRAERRLDDEQLVAAAHEDGLAAVEAEQVHLAVARHEAAVGCEQHAGVEVAGRPRRARRTSRRAARSRARRRAPPSAPTSGPSSGCACSRAASTSNAPTCHSSGSMTRSASGAVRSTSSRPRVTRLATGSRAGAVELDQAEAHCHAPTLRRERGRPATVPSCRPQPPTHRPRAPRHLAGGARDRRRDLGAPPPTSSGGCPTPCPGWSVGDVVAHLIDIEQLMAGSPRPDHEPDWASLPHVQADFGRFTEVGVDCRRAHAREDVLAELQETIALRRSSSMPCRRGPR